MVRKAGQRNAARPPQEPVYSMSYYEALGLKKEPFSTSPDPAFFYPSRQYKAALCRLRISITLKRGLSLILGDVGTGKTTLSRKLAQVLREEPDVLFHMILNPYFKSQEQFLLHVARLFHVPASELDDNATGMELMQAIERFLFRRGVEHGKTIVLLIDEAQMLPDHCFEILRILLNYETNEYKILQLILVGQMELHPRLSSMYNFWDRIALKYLLNPLDEDELAQIIEFRLTQAGYHDIHKLFNEGALRLIFKHTQGYPRKFTLLCHNALESLIMHDKQVVDEETIRRLIEDDVKPAMLPAENICDAV